MFESTTTLDMPARTNRGSSAPQARATVQNSFAPGAVDLPSPAPIMYTLMFRNIASDGFVFSDPQSPGDVSRDSEPGGARGRPVRTLRPTDSAPDHPDHHAGPGRGWDPAEE